MGKTAISCCTHYFYTQDEVAARVSTSVEAIDRGMSADLEAHPFLDNRAAAQ